MSQRRGIRKPLLVLAFMGALVLLAPASASAIQVDSQPSISGGSNPPYETETLTANDGSYQTELFELGPITTERRWQRCNSAGTGCVDTVDDGPTYTLDQSDVGSTIRLQVDADCGLCSSATGTSNTTGVVREASPAITAQPAFTRTGAQGRTLTAQPVSTSGKPTVTVGRQWLRCDDAGLGSCDPISGATGQSYKLSTGDVGKEVRLRAIARNGVGPDAQDTSASTGQIVAAPPTFTALPRVSGDPRSGSVLGSTTGTLSGEGPFTFARAWARCTSTDQASCTFIPGATTGTYTPRPADVGRRLRVAVTAGGLGNTVGVSGPSAVVAAPTPTFVDVPPASTPTASAPGLLSPFPRIGIAGRARRTSTRLTKFLVRAPRGSRITVRCRGRGCPFGRASARAGRRAVRFRRLQRSLRRGTVIEVFITSPGKIGKYARFRFRRRRAPTRVDGCLQPGARRPSPCP